MTTSEWSFILKSLGLEDDRILVLEHFTWGVAGGAEDFVGGKWEQQN